MPPTDDQQISSPVDPMDVNTLNEKQKEALEDLKNRFSDNPEPYVHDGSYLTYWLKARRFDVDKAESMLRYHLKYRKALYMDSPGYKNFPMNPLFEKYYPEGKIGYDKAGRPIIYLPYGGIDNKGLFSSARHSEMMLTILYHLEQRRWSCEEASRRAGRPVRQVLHIYDLKGIGTKHLWKPGMDVFMQISETAQHHAPEIIYRLIVVNAPNIFHTLFKLIKPILDENLQRKIIIYGDDFKEALLKDIDPDQLPAHYGGELFGPDGDPKCSHAINYGGDVPIECYFDPSVNPPPENLTDLVVNRSSQSLIPVIAEKPMTELKWYFKNEASNDVGFAIYKKTNDSQTDVSEMEMIVPYIRLMTFRVPEWGNVILKEPGTYVVQFDNTYSWIHKKYIKYSLTLRDASTDLTKEH